MTKKRPFLNVAQLTKLKRELETGRYSRFRVTKCEAPGCNNPIPREDGPPVEGEPKTRFCSSQCYFDNTDEEIQEAT